MADGCTLPGRFIVGIDGGTTTCWCVRHITSEGAEWLVHLVEGVRLALPPLLCSRCGHPIEDHSAFGDEPDPDLLARMTEARFPFETSGLYCPHLDMVAGVDYDDDGWGYA